MAKLLALDWDTHHLRLILASRQPNRLKVEYAKSFPLQNGDESPELAKQLDELLADSKFKGADVFAAVRRNDVELRTISIPPVPADEVADTIRFQAMREFSEVADNWPIDYLPLQKDAEHVSVLAAAISPERMASYRTPIQGQDLKTTSFILRPTATASLVAELEAEDRAEVELCIEDLADQFEITVLKNQCPVVIRTVQAPKSDDYDRAKFLAQEVRRTTLASQSQLAGSTIERVVIFGEATGDSKATQETDELSKLLSLPVKVLDPFQHVFVSESVSAEALQHRGQFAATIGLLLGTDAEESHLIDFLNPRKAPPPKSSRDRIVAVTTLALLVGLLAAGGFYYYLGKLDEKTLGLQRTLQDQKDTVTAAESRLQNYQSVEQWMQGRVDWLQQLEQISNRVPGPDDARFDRMTANLSSSTGHGQIILEGLANQQTTIARIDESLRTDGRGVTSAGGEFEGRDSQLPWKFKHTVKIETAAGKKIAAARASRGRRRLGR